MKKLLSVCCIALLIAAIPALADGDKTKKSGCSTTKVADGSKSGCTVPGKATRVSDDKKGCSSDKTKVAKVAELITVSGTIVNCKETMGKVASDNGMCPTGTPASGKALLVQSDCGKQILVTAMNKIALAKGITKVRATGKMEGTHLIASKLEAWSEANGWKEVEVSAEASE